MSAVSAKSGASSRRINRGFTALGDLVTMRIEGKVRTMHAATTIATFDPAANQVMLGAILILGSLLLLISP